MCVRVTEFQRERQFFISSICDCCPVFFSFFYSFVSDVVHIYYINDEAVQEDEEIQAFVKDVCNFGMQDFDYCGGCTLKKSYFFILASQQLTNVKQGTASIINSICPFIDKWFEDVDRKP